MKPRDGLFPSALALGVSKLRAQTGELAFALDADICRHGFAGGGVVPAADVVVVITLVFVVVIVVVGEEADQGADA